MTKRPVPQVVTIVAPVDAMTAARAEAYGYEVDHPAGRVHPVVKVTLPVSDPVAIAAADFVDPDIEGQSIVLDFSKGLRRLHDETPPVAPAVPGPSRSPLWARPVISQLWAGVAHLPSTAGPDDLPVALLAWMQGGLPVDHAREVELQSVWSRQAHAMLAHATSRVESCREALTEEEFQGLVNRLHDLAEHIRRPRDGGRYWEEDDWVQDEYGGSILKPAHWYINESYDAILDACDRTAAAGNERSRSERTHAELRAITTLFRDDVPDRYAKARALDLLGSMVGAARTELLPIVWPGWRYLSDAQNLKAAVNPSEAALDRLAAERAFDVKKRKWPHDPVTLRWLVPDKTLVLVTSFLGRVIAQDVAVDGNDPS